MSLSKPANFDQAQTIVPCDVCETETGEHYCTVCRQTLCNGCEKFHKKVASSRNHQVVPRSQMASVTASTSCSRHPDETLSLQCEPCKILVCIKCVTGEHRGHPMVELSKIYEGEKEKVEKDIHDIEEKTIPTLKNAITDVHMKRDEYKKAIIGIKKEMDDELKELKGRIYRIHADRLKQLAEMEAEGLRKFDIAQNRIEEKKRSHTHDVSEYKTMVASNNQAQFLSFARTRGTTAKVHEDAVLEFPSPPTLHKVKTGNKDISDLLSKLITSDMSCAHINKKIEEPTTATIANKSIFKQAVKPTVVSTVNPKLQGPPGICLTADGKAWIGGWESNELKLVDRSGKVFKTRWTKNRPWALAMMSFGDIIQSPHYADSNSVTKLQTDGTECPILDVSSSASTGVSVTENGDILVCTGDGRVARLDENGANVRQLYDGKKPYSAIHAIELPNGNICISDQANQALIIIDKNGKVMKRITKPLGVQNYDPWGLAYSSVGNILSADKNNDRVYIVGQNGVVRELVGKSHGIQAPMWLAVDSEDNLWIAQSDGHIKVVKYLAYF